MEARVGIEPAPTLIPGNLLILRYAKNVENAKGA
jgi:hypothetical protein